MTGFANTRELVDAIEDGNSWTGSWYKLPGQANVTRTWIDMSMTSGKPVPQYYASSPLEAATLDGSRSYDLGPIGGDKYLAQSVHNAGHTNVTGGTTWLWTDTLLYYPFVDMDSLDQQDLVNDVALPRYSTGFGVQMYLVALTPYNAGGAVTVSYTNSDGVAGRSTGSINLNNAGIITTIMHGGVFAGGAGCFLPLQGDDKGVRSVESVTCSAGNGGLAAVVLCKPLAHTTFNELVTLSAVETDYCLDRGFCMPKIEDGAYLNQLALCTNSLAARAIVGSVTTVRTG